MAKDTRRGWVQGHSEHRNSERCSTRQGISEHVGIVSTEEQPATRHSQLDQQPPSRATADVDWVFGYGSLIWRPAFPYVESRVAVIEGWERKFWQGSPDHRGTPESPGRVVTLVANTAAVCWGRAYRLHAEHREQILQQLDVREQGGYERHLVSLFWPGESEKRVGDHSQATADATAERALLYVAASSNEHYLGPASLAAMAEQIVTSSGPSGDNVEYVIELERALSQLGGIDPHVSAIAAEIRRQLVAHERPGFY